VVTNETGENAAERAPGDLVTQATIKSFAGNKKKGGRPLDDHPLTDITPKKLA
jgi:hypothetical protein